MHQLNFVLTYCKGLFIQPSIICTEFQHVRNQLCLNDSLIITPVLFTLYGIILHYSLMVIRQRNPNVRINKRKHLYLSARSVTILDCLRAESRTIPSPALAAVYMAARQAGRQPKLRVMPFLCTGRPGDLKIRSSTEAVQSSAQEGEELTSSMAQGAGSRTNITELYSLNSLIYIA